MRRRAAICRCWSLAALVSLNWLAARGADAQAQPPAASQTEANTCATCDPEEQHDGLYLRLSVGLGATAIGGSIGTAAAFGGSSSFAIGHFILPHLALSLDLFGANAYDLPLSAEWAATTSKVDARTLAAGVSLTYYLPLDFYISAGPGIGWLMLSSALAEPQLSGAGFALDALAGKEFWIGRSWALGVGIQFIYVRGDGGIDAVDDAWSLGTLFTVTKN
jgi:hypothetical protein